jgi:hypothetical protein
MEDLPLPHFKPMPLGRIPQPRLHELMNQVDDPYGDMRQASASMRGDRYCAPRYLPRGKRLS